MSNELSSAQISQHLQRTTKRTFEKQEINEAFLEEVVLRRNGAISQTALLLMSGYEFNLDWYDMAQEVITSQAELSLRQPLGFGQWLIAADLALGPLRGVAVLGNDHDPGRQALLDELWVTYRPRTIGAVSDLPVPNGAPAVLKDRSLLENQTTAYVCQDYSCRKLIIDPRKFSKELDTT